MTKVLITGGTGFFGVNLAEKLLEKGDDVILYDINHPPKEMLDKVFEIDEGASYLGEIALVPHSSPISQSNLLFYNVLIDENASCHIALGKAYKPCLENGDKMSDEEFMTAGGNISLTHIDFMIGSGEMDVDGIIEDGTVEAIMRKGEWAFDV